MVERIIQDNEAGQRFDKYLLKVLKLAPSSFVHKMLRKKNILLNQQKADGKEKLQKEDRVTFYLSDETFQKFVGIQRDMSIYEDAYDQIISDYKGPLPVVYEDEHIVVFNKPVNLLSQKDASNLVSLNEYFIGYLLKNEKISPADLDTFMPSICNRLDRNTTGLIVCGKSLLGLQTMNQLFLDRTLHKYYHCIVAGRILTPIELRGYLTKDEETNRVTISTENSKDSSYIETKLVPIQHNERTTLLEVELVTGKTHQIRAHLASINHPIIGDYKYGLKSVNQEYSKNYQVKSQLLHSYKLVFPKLSEPFEYLSNMEILAKEPAVYEKILDGGNR